MLCFQVMFSIFERIFTDTRGKVQLDGKITPETSTKKEEKKIAEKFFVIIHKQSRRT